MRVKTDKDTWRSTPLEGTLVADIDSYLPRIQKVEGGVEISAGARATSARAGVNRVFLSTGDFPKVVLLRRIAGPRGTAKAEGPAVAWSFCDAHGSELVAVLRRGESFELWFSPAYGRSGPGSRQRG